jgi:murein DD-endopeptidase MepM/ murein hydrolase activator NlpD
MLILFGSPLLGPGPASQQILGVSDLVASTRETERPPIAPQADPGRTASISARRARPVAPPVESLTGYQWPIPGARITLPFGPTPWGSWLVDGVLFHDGIDLATFCGDRVTAAHAGTVLAAGRHYDDFLGWVGDLTAYTARLDAKHLWSNLPNVVVIDDGNGYRSIYAHFEKLVVAVGDTVRAGQLLGFEGMTGHATGCHLHYGIFSPNARTTFGNVPAAIDHMLLPTEELARVDPLLVLPPPASAGIK